MVLGDVTELYAAYRLLSTPIMVLTVFSDYSGNHTKLSKILLNGNNICMVQNSFTDRLQQSADVQKLIPGGEGPTASG
jgi:hypothetical protein